MRSPSANGWCLACQAHAAALLGDLTAAGELVDEADRVNRPSARLHQVEREVASAWVAAARGGFSRAERRARGAVRMAASRGQRGLEAHATHDAIRLGDHGLSKRMTALASTVDGPLVAVFAAHAAALVLSVRTVNNHLNHIYGKLGIGREDLPRLFTP